MKLGIVGGLGPASTIDYYRDIVDHYRKVYGDDVYPEIVIDSVNMKSVISKIEEGDYASVGRQIVESIHALELAGADIACIASNSPHVAWDYINGKTNIPVISIIDANCDYIIEHQYKKVLIFATKFTMKNGLHTRAFDKRGINWVLPNEEDIEIIGNIIYPNLENGIVIPSEKEKMIAVAEKYIRQYGCDSMLLGCTEIPLMIKEGDVSVPVISSTDVHVAKLSKILTGEK